MARNQPGDANKKGQAKTAQAKLSRLRELGNQPNEQLDYALQLVRTENNAELLQAALVLITEMEEAKARPTLREKYLYFRREGARYDGDGSLRSALLLALQPVAHPDDADLFEQAINTYGSAPPSPYDQAGNLRASGLVGLAELKPELAAYHCTRLLADPRNSLMTGEPALTAAKLLGARGQTLPLYAYLLWSLEERAESRSDVIAECLRGLKDLPPALLPGLIQPYLTRNGEISEEADEIVLLGLFDLLLEHPSGAAYTEAIQNFLRATRQLHLYRYQVIALVARKQTAQLDQLEAAAKLAKDNAKLAILKEARALA